MGIFIVKECRFYKFFHNAASLTDNKIPAVFSEILSGAHQNPEDKWKENNVDRYLSYPGGDHVTQKSKDTVKLIMII